MYFQNRTKFTVLQCTDSPANPAEDMCTNPLLGTKIPLKVSFDFE